MAVCVALGGCGSGAAVFLLPYDLGVYQRVEALSVRGTSGEAGAEQAQYRRTGNWIDRTALERVMGRLGIAAAIVADETSWTAEDESGLLYVDLGVGSLQYFNRRAPQAGAGLSDADAVAAAKHFLASLELAIPDFHYHTRAAPGADGGWTVGFERLAADGTPVETAEPPLSVTLDGAGGVREMLLDWPSFERGETVRCISVEEANRRASARGSGRGAIVRGGLDPARAVEAERVELVLAPLWSAKGDPCLVPCYKYTAEAGALLVVALPEGTFRFQE